MVKLFTKTNAVFATGFLAIALASGGATTALWKKNASLGSPSITNGNISLAQSEAVFQKSGCFLDKITPANPKDWKITAGENAFWNQDLTASFTGENAASDLELSWDQAPIIPKTWIGVYSIYAYDENGDVSDTPLTVEYKNNNKEKYRTYVSDRTANSNIDLNGSPFSSEDNTIQSLIDSGKAIPIDKDAVVSIKDTPVNKDVKYKIVYSVVSGLNNDFEKPSPYMVDVNGKQITEDSNGQDISDNFKQRIFDADKIDFTHLTASLKQKRSGPGYSSTSSPTSTPGDVR